MYLDICGELENAENEPSLAKCLFDEAVNELSEVEILMVFKPSVVFCDFDGVVMNRFSFIMEANQPTNAMKKLHVEAQKARI